MTKVRNCNAANLDTGQSKCQLDMPRVKGALVLKRGVKLPADLTPEKLEELCHAAPAERVRPIYDFVEYALGGGEAQVSAVGYGPNQVTDISARTDTFTMGKYSEHLASAITKAMNTEYDVYYFDENHHLYGLNDGTDALAGFPMSTIYHGGAPHPTSGGRATQTINFAHADARAAIEDFDWIDLGFDPRRFAYGLIPVKFVKEGTSGNKYRLVEATGKLDRTEEFGEIIASTPSAVLKGSVTGVTYDADENVITMTGSEVPVLKDPASLFSAGVKGVIAAV